VLEPFDLSARRTKRGDGRRSVYRRPRDLVATGYKPGARAFPNKGARVGRLNEKNELVPYYDRAAIEAGALDGQKLEIC
jgi:membrane-bound lytic murein transglycosylase A